MRAAVSCRHMERPSLRAAFANWKIPDRSWREKLRMTFSNTALKLRNRSNCCGNHGQPGC